MKLVVSALLHVLLLGKDVSDAFSLKSRCSTTLTISSKSTFHHLGGWNGKCVKVGNGESRLFAEDEKGVLDALQPWKIDIPEEYRDEILKAEANTQAAKDRGQRIAIYLTLTVICAFIAFSNGFLTTVRGEDPNALNDLGVLWIQENPVTNFFFLNGIGGSFALIVAGVCGTTAELEQRSRNDNAERIWKELNRRKEESTKKSNKKQSKLNKQGKKKGFKQKKRLAALSEVIVEEEEEITEQVSATEQHEEKEEPVAIEEEKKDGIFGKMKDLYKQADSMAASQALLMNKELEDRGIIDKITDESGLRVIGKEEAAKLQQQKVEETSSKKEE